jgi:hypothetical protein
MNNDGASDWVLMTMLMTMTTQQHVERSLSNVSSFLNLA